MTWVKIDDQFHAHPKAARAWKRAPRALGLHLLALSYCAAYLTDGFVPEEFVEGKVPNDNERTKVMVALESSGIWVAVTDGWLIHDFLDYNPSRAEVEVEAEARQQQARNAANARWHPNGAAHRNA